MDLKNINLELLESIAEKAQKAYSILKALKEVSDKSRENKTPILISLKETAALLQVSVAHLAVLRHRGTGPIYTKIAGSVYYDVSDIFDYMMNCKQRSTND